MHSTLTIILRAVAAGEPSSAPGSPAAACSWAEACWWAEGYLSAAPGYSLDEAYWSVAQESQLAEPVSPLAARACLLAEGCSSAVQAYSSAQVLPSEAPVYWWAERVWLLEEQECWSAALEYSLEALACWSAALEYSLEALASGLALLSPQSPPQASHQLQVSPVAQSESQPEPQGSRPLSPALLRPGLVSPPRLPASRLTQELRQPA
jgi:hypothetical protein